jgi:hypothetical protein
VEIVHVSIPEVRLSQNYIVKRESRSFSHAKPWGTGRCSHKLTACKFPCLGMVGGSSRFGGPFRSSVPLSHVDIRTRNYFQWSFDTSLRACRDCFGMGSRSCCRIPRSILGNMCRLDSQPSSGSPCWNGQYRLRHFDRDCCDRALPFSRSSVLLN